MHATARALVIASISDKDAVAVNRELFLRFYGDEFEPRERKKILLALRNAAELAMKRERKRRVSTLNKRVLSQVKRRGSRP